MFADAIAEAVSASGGFGIAKAASGAGGLPTSPSLPGLPSAAASGVQGVLTSGFGARIDPITGERSNHTGIDLAAPTGTPIPAAKAGVVIQCGPRGGYGDAIEIAHPDGTSTLYGHTSGVNVAPGDRIEAGQIIGWVGETGRTTGPHLHLEVRKAGQFLDPRTALKAYRLRAEDESGGSP
ncbi:MAG: M23 family metallopeptidase [Archangium sp.]